MATRAQVGPATDSGFFYDAFYPGEATVYQHPPSGPHFARAFLCFPLLGLHERKFDIDRSQLSWERLAACRSSHLDNIVPSRSSKNSTFRRSKNRFSLSRERAGTGARAKRGLTWLFVQMRQLIALYF